MRFATCSMKTTTAPGQPELRASHGRPLLGQHSFLCVTPSLLEAFQPQAHAWGCCYAHRWSLLSRSIPPGSLRDLVQSAAATGRVRPVQG
jgi:hypothetical protein